jgi:DNA-binding transcriptional ArsR family regulator
MWGARHPAVLFAHQGYIRRAARCPAQPQPFWRAILHRSVQYQGATLDRKFFALSDPTRRSILERLARGPANLGELAAPFGLTLNGVKKHVGVLEEVDLVKTSKVGRSRECRLGPAELQDVTHWIDSYRRAMEQRLEAFGAYVEARTARDG